MDPDPNMVTEQNFLDRLLPDDVFESFNPLVPMSTHLALQPTEPDPLAFSFPAPVDVTHPRSCPPLSLARSPPNDQAPLLELPMNIQQLPQGGADPMIFTTSEPAVREDVIPIPPADFSASHSPTVRCRPIVPRTPAPSVIPTPATPSSRICTPMSALAISEGVQQPPPTSLPPSMSTPPSTTMRIAKRKHRRCKLPGTPVTPTTATTPPILDQVLSSSHMKAFGTSERDVSMAFDMVNQCVQERAHGCKIKLRKLLKDDSKVTSSQREAKVSRLFHHEVLRGYQGALMEVIGAWYKASAALHHANEQQKRSGL